MDDLENKLSQLLSSPEDMAKIMDLAKQISGEAAPSSAEKRECDKEPAIDPQLMAVATRLLREMRTDGDGKLALAETLAPYLEPERRNRLQKAVRLARLAKVAKSFLGEIGGGELHL